MEDNGVLYLKTRMTTILSELPVLECASDIYKTVAPQHKRALSAVGLSNYLFPNDPAIRNFSYMYDLECVSLDGPLNAITREDPYRRYYRMVKAQNGPVDGGTIKARRAGEIGGGRD